MLDGNIERACTDKKVLMHASSNIHILLVVISNPPDLMDDYGERDPSLHCYQQTAANGRLQALKSNT
jgi:hypothetical protein